MLKGSVFVFVLVCFGFSWLVWAPLLVERQFLPGIYLWRYQFFLASFGPLAGAIAATAYEGGRVGLVSWMKHRVFNLATWRSWTLVLALILTYFLASFACVSVAEGAMPDIHKWGLSDKLPGLPVWQVAIAWMMTYGFGEESGWRGWLFARLAEGKSPIRAAIIVGVIWMLWHLPAFWFNANYQHMGWGIIGWCISLCYGSVLLSWMYMRYKSVMPLVLWHGGFDLLTASEYVPPMVPMVISTMVIVHGILLSRRLARSWRGVNV